MFKTNKENVVGVPMKKVKNKPLLSIAVLSNNSSNLERCINSLLNQTYQNIEIVILNLANEKNIIIDNFLVGFSTFNFNLLTSSCQSTSQV